MKRVWLKAEVVDGKEVNMLVDTVEVNGGAGGG